MRPITVFIAHRHKASLTACLELVQGEAGVRVVGGARSGLEMINAVARLKPHVLFVDLNLVKGPKVELLLALRQKSPGTRVILLTRRASEAQILEVLSYGVRGYLDERVISAFLLKAVRQVHAGEAWVPRKMVAKIIDRLAGLTALHHLPVK